MSKYKFIDNILFREVNMVLQLNNYANFSIEKIDKNHAHRITLGMISIHEKEKIQNEIEKFDNEEIINLVQKDGLYKIFQEYTDIKPIGYVLYKLKNKKASSYYFDDDFKLLAKKYVDNPVTSLEPLQVNPTDWLKMRNEKYSTVKNELDRKFVDRTNFENFSLDNLSGLEADLSRALKNESSNERLKAQLATILMQNLPTRKRLKRALILLESLKDKRLVEEYTSIKNTVLDMLKFQSPRSRITRVNWGVFNRCPLTCKGCYNIFNKDVMSVAECKRIIDKLVVSGVEELIVSGGDPLLWPDLIEFCRYAKEKGLKIGIDTVSYNLNIRLLYQLKDLIEYLGIPLDGIDQKTIETFRKGKKDLLEKVLYNLSLADTFSVPIRLNTTVSKRNVESLNSLAEIVSKHKSIKSWSIYQWWPLRSGDKLSDQMKIGDREFKTATEALKEKNKNIDFHERLIGARQRNTFFISSNGEVYTFGEDVQISTIIIGDIKRHTVKEILKSPALDKNSRKFKPIERFNNNVSFELEKKIVA